MNKPTNTGVMLIICAPSGTGKSTLVRRLTSEFPAFAFSVSCTTRTPRPGEIPGQDYHFLSKEEFIHRRETKYFAEWAEVHGNFYGTPRQATTDLLAQGRDLVFDIDVQGATQLKTNLGRGCFIFVFPPSRAVLEQRLAGRKTDNPQTIARRLAAASTEITASTWFDHWIVNADLDQAYDQLRGIYLAEKTRPQHQHAWREALAIEWGQG